MLYLPNILKIKFSNKIKKCFEIFIDEKEYLKCEEASRNRWSNTKIGGYGRGIVNSSKDPFKVERTGLLGELAFAKVFDLEVDFSYKKFGDEYDFIYKNMKIDVKTETYLHDYHCGLIYSVSASGKKIPIKSDLYVFSFIKEDNQENKNAKVVLIGTIFKSEVEKKPDSPAKVKKLKHKNKEIPYSELHSIHNLYNYSFLL